MTLTFHRRAARQLLDIAGCSNSDWLLANPPGTLLAHVSWNHKRCELRLIKRDAHMQIDGQTFQLYEMRPMRYLLKHLMRNAAC